MPPARCASAAARSPTRMEQLMTDEELYNEFLKKLARGDFEHDPDPFLTIAGVAMEYYVSARRKQLEKEPEVGPEAFKGVGEID